MQKIILYRYRRSDGGTTIGPNEPEPGVEYTTLYRLISDEGKALTDGTDFVTPCIDVDDVDGWYEIDEPIPEPVEEEISAEEALAIITGEGETS